MVQPDKHKLDLLETIDVSLLKQLLKAPKGTPKEMLYLELGCIPFREIVREKRLRFLHYILNEEPKSIVHRCFLTQMKNKNKKDWVTTVLDYLSKLELTHMTMEGIKNMRKTSVIKLRKQRINRKAFKTLEDLKKKIFKSRKH